MAKAGLKYLVMGSNGDRDNMQNGNAPTLFYLAGPDGRDPGFSVCQYGEGFDLITYEDPYSGTKVQGLNMDEGEQTIAHYFDRHERSGYPFDSIALQSYNDFTPPFKQLSEVARAWNADWAYPTLRLSTIPEFFITSRRRKPIAFPTCAVGSQSMGGLGTRRSQLSGAGAASGEPSS